MIVRWGLDQLARVLGELAVARPVLVTSARWRDLDLPVTRRFDGVRPHTPRETVEAAAREAAAADAIVGLGGGSAIDTAKAVSATTRLPVVSIPTTYAGAEWSPFFGMRDEARGVKSGGGGAMLAGIVYEPRLTLDLPRETTVGTALNALAHCAEALYARGRDPRADEAALAGAALIAEWLPRVVERPRDEQARTRLLEGAMHGGEALAASGLALGHAVAQALGGRYGLPHGALNAIALPAALRFNREAAPDAIERLGEAMRTDDPAAKVEELAELAGFRRLRDLGVPPGELDEVAEAVAVRPGARSNPRPASVREIAALLRALW